MSASYPTTAGPNFLCVDCGTIANHVSLRCASCRALAEPALTDADYAYLDWQRQRSEPGA